MGVETIWRELAGSLHGFIRRRVPDEATADDLLQDVFVRIHERWDQLADDERVGAWVYRIARNRIADHYRERKTPPATALEGDAAAALDDAAWAADASEEAQARQNELVGGWLAAMIETLPETYRDAVRMVETEGASQAEVASRLGLSLSGAKSRVQRGRKELGRLLAQCCHVEIDRRGNVLDIRRRRPCC